MLKKITLLLASPRSLSASRFYADYLVQQLNPGLFTINQFDLSKLNYQDCIACYACQQGFDKCILKDDLDEVLESVRHCDILLISSPIFFDSPPATLKAFLDRCQSYYKPDFLKLKDKSRLKPGKTLVFITTQEQKGIDRYKAFRDSWHFHFKIFGFTSFHFLAADGLGIDPKPEEKQDFLKQLSLCAQKLSVRKEALS